MMPMRRGLAVLALLLALLAGCATQPQYLSQEQISPEFSCRAAVTSASGEWDAAVSHTAENGFSCEGEAVSYYWSGGQFYESCAGLESPKGSCTLPKTSYALQLKEFLTEIYEGTLEPVDGETLKGSCAFGTFLVKADGNSGALREIRCDGAGFRAVFYTPQT